MRRLLVIAALAVALVGCDGGEEAATTDTVSAPPTTNDIRVYFLREGKVWPVVREAPVGSPQANAALQWLFLGPTEQEKNELGLTTAIPEVLSWTLLGPPDGQRGAASVKVSARLSRPALAQLVYTLTQFPLLEAIIVQNRDYRRSDFEDLTPAILVESPLAFDDVPNPVHAFGTANTFEANFSYELTTPDREIVEENFVTATSGTGTRGTFEFVTDPYDVDFEGMGALTVFELSAKDGSRINVVEIPIRMTR